MFHVKHCVKQSVKHCVKQSVKHCVKQSVKQLTKDPKYKYISGLEGNRTPISAMRMPCNAIVLRAQNFSR